MARRFQYKSLFYVPLASPAETYIPVFSQGSVSITQPYRVQYQSLADALQPMSGSVETITVDKWLVSPEILIRRKNLNFVYQSYFDPYYPISAPVETITVEKWLPDTETPVLKRNNISYRLPYIFRGVGLADPLLTSWGQPTEQPRRAKTSRDFLRESLSFNPYPVTPVVETITVEKWYQFHQTPVRAKKQPFTFPYIFGGDYPVASTIVPATAIFSSQTVTITTPVRFQYQAYFKDLNWVIPQVLSDKWGQPISQPFFKRKNYSRIYPVSVFDVYPISVPFWTEKFPTATQTFTDKVYNSGSTFSDKTYSATNNWNDKF